MISKVIEKYRKYNLIYNAQKKVLICYEPMLVKDLATIKRMLKGVEIRIIER